MAVSIGCASCASVALPLPGHPYTQGNVVDAGDYTVTGPAGEGWFVTPCPSFASSCEGTRTGFVGFSRRRLEADGSIGEVTTIAVGRNAMVLAGGPWPPPPGVSVPTAEEISAKYFDEREANLRREAAASRVTNVQRSVESIDGKTLYRMSCVVAAPDEGLTYDNAIYMYFPTGFENRRMTYYLFLFAHGYRPGAPTGDLTAVIPVIRSFALK